MAFKVGYKTDIGKKRSQNQDSLISVPEAGLFIVADGMGGHKGGEIASAMAVETIAASIKEAQTDPNWQAANILRQAILNANQAIFDRSYKESALRGMGTTTTALLFQGDRLFIGHVGDSRCYFFDLAQGDLENSAIWQLTRDHSLVQEKLRAGLLTREQAEKDQMKNVITRSVGFEQHISVEIYEKKVQPGDTFLICSDGLSGLMSGHTLLSIVHQHLALNKNIDQATQALIQQANSNGGDDNISAILVQC